jgi:transposase
MAEFQRARRSKEDRAITAERISQAVDVYREHFDDRPIRAVAAAFGVSERTANSWITRARNPPYNFLPKTTRGKKAL